MRSDSNRPTPVRERAGQAASHNDVQPIPSPLAAGAIVMLLGLLGAVALTLWHPAAGTRADFAWVDYAVLLVGFGLTLIGLDAQSRQRWG